jgi:hypothetical protein
MSGFERTETSTVEDGPAVRYKLIGHGLNGPQISASRNGVGIGGWWPIIDSKEILDMMVAQMETAWSDFERLRCRPE